MRSVSLRSIVAAVTLLALPGLLAMSLSSHAARANGPTPTPTVCYGPTKPCVAISPVAGGIHPTPTASSRSQKPGRLAAFPHQVQVTSHGIELTLAVPRTSYPQDALVRVSMTVRNVSNHKVWLQGGGPPEPGKSFPQVEVVDKNGNVVYPPALDGFFPYPGPGPSFVPLPKGRVMRVQAYVVLRRSYLRATVPVLKNGRFMVIAGQVTTPALRIHLTPADAPQVHVNASEGHVSATIEPTTQARGRILYIDAALCGNTNFSEHVDWTPGSHTLTAGCSPLQAWYLAVGWLNHSVATVDYKPV